MGKIAKFNTGEINENNDVSCIPDMPDACFEAAFESLQMHTFLMCSGHIRKELLPFRIQCAFRKTLDAILIQCLVFFNSNAVYT